MFPGGSAPGAGTGPSLFGSTPGASAGAGTNTSLFGNTAPAGGSAAGGLFTQPPAAGG